MSPEQLERATVIVAALMRHGALPLSQPQRSVEFAFLEAGEP